MTRVRPFVCDGVSGPDEVAGAELLPHAVRSIAATPTIASRRADFSDIEPRSVAAGAGAEDDHPAFLADEHAGGHRRLAGMLERDRGIAALADGVPQRLAEPPRLRHPLLLPRRVTPVRRHAPVLVIAPVDPAGRAELPAVLVSNPPRDHRDRNASADPHELDRL